MSPSAAQKVSHIMYMHQFVRMKRSLPYHVLFVAKRKPPMVNSCTGIYPNVTLEGTATPKVTQLNQMFIYSWSPTVQATCPGAVTKLEYCYQRIAVQTITIPIFTLVFLKPDIRGFRVTHTINVAAGDLNSCTMRGGVNTCCETKVLERLEQFRVPSISTAFGIYAVGKNRILGYSVGQEDSVTGYQLAIDLMDDGLVRVAANDTATVEYRMLNLISGKWQYNSNNMSKLSFCCKMHD